MDDAHGTKTPAETPQLTYDFSFSADSQVTGEPHSEMPHVGATFVPGGMDDYYMPEVVAPSPQRCVNFPAAQLSPWIWCVSNAPPIVSDMVTHSDPRHHVDERKRAMDSLLTVSSG